MDSADSLDKTLLSFSGRLPHNPPHCRHSFVLQDDLSYIADDLSNDNDNND